MKRDLSSHILLSFIKKLAVFLLFIAPSTYADWQLNLREGVTEISRSVYSLHMIIFWIF